MDNPDKLPT